MAKVIQVDEMEKTVNEYTNIEENTLLIGNFFERCHKACAQCTAISSNSEKFVTHCQAKPL